MSGFAPQSRIFRHAGAGFSGLEALAAASGIGHLFKGGQPSLRDQKELINHQGNVAYALADQAHQHALLQNSSLENIRGKNAVQLERTRGRNNIEQSRVDAFGANSLERTRGRNAVRLERTRGRNTMAETLANNQHAMNYQGAEHTAAKDLLTHQADLHERTTSFNHGLGYHKTDLAENSDVVTDQAIRLTEATQKMAGNNTPEAPAAPAQDKPKPTLCADCGGKHLPGGRHKKNSTPVQGTLL